MGPMYSAFQIYFLLRVKMPQGISHDLSQWSQTSRQIAIKTNRLNKSEGRIRRVFTLKEAIPTLSPSIPSQTCLPKIYIPAWELTTTGIPFA